MRMKFLGMPSMLLQGGGDFDDTPNEDERILQQLDTDLDPIPPDGSRQRVPDQSEFDLNEDLNPPIERVAPQKETPPEVEVEEVDQSELLKQYKLDKYENVEDVLKDYSSNMEKVQMLADLMRKAQLEVSDDPLQDLNDMIESAMAGRMGLVAGAQPPPPGGGEAQPVQGSAPPPPQVNPPRSGDGTRSFLNRYQTMNWNEDVIKDLATALREHLSIPEAPKVDGFISRQEVEPLATMNRRLFEQTLVQDHIIQRLASGDKLPNNYRAQLMEAIQKNPQPMERALRGYVLRGRAGDVMSDYARTIPLERDERTGLDKATMDAMADETARLAKSKRSLKGGDAPPSRVRKSEPSLRDLEMDIEKLGRKII